MGPQGNPGTMNLIQPHFNFPATAASPLPTWWMSCFAERRLRSLRRRRRYFSSCRTARGDLLDRCLPPPLDRACARASRWPFIAPTTATASIGFWRSFAPAASRFRSIRNFRSAKCSRILADSGTEILVTDKTVFERTILDRSALNVRTWIQADEEAETLDGFVRVRIQRRAICRRLTSIRPRRLRSFTLPAPADFPRERHSQATPCSAHARPQCFPGFFSARGIWHLSHCPGRTLWPSALRFTA